MAESSNFTNTAATTAAVTNRFVVSANMSLTPYTIANASPVWSGACNVTITHTTVAGTDTLGTITIVGKDLNNLTISEVLTPVADSTVTSTKAFRSVTSATSLGWVAVSTADTIVIGCAAGSIASASSGVLGNVVVNATAAATVVISDKTGTIATLAASIANGTYPYNLVYNGFLKVATTSTNDVTVGHTGTQPPFTST